MNTVELFSMLAYIPEGSEAKIGFDLQLNEELTLILGEDEMKTLVWKAIEAAYNGFNQAEVGGDPILVDPKDYKDNS